jgi:hypothetical protein
MVLIQLSIILIFCRFYDVFSVYQEDSWYCWRWDDMEYRHLFVVNIPTYASRLMLDSLFRAEMNFSWCVHDPTLIVIAHCPFDCCCLS